MSRPEDDDAPTELIPAVETGEGLANTRELPAVTDDPPPAAPPAPPAAPRPAAPPAAAPPARPPAPPSARPPAPAAPSGRPALLGAATVLLVVVLALVGYLVLGGDDGTGTAAGPPAPARPIEPEVSSFDPSGGSGFRRDGEGWVTQTYRTAGFGNLKEGVGLVLDLGTARSPSAVRFRFEGATVQLRSADEEADAISGWSPVGAARQADGEVELPAQGRHRYWLIWVTELAAGTGGFSTGISEISVTGS